MSEVQGVYRLLGMLRRDFPKCRIVFSSDIDAYVQRVQESGFSVRHQPRAFIHFFC